MTFKRLSAKWRKMQSSNRLMLAFSVLASSTIVLAFVGWMGLTNTDNALSDFEQKALPDVSKSLELAERTANLAAVAPYVASVSSPFMLEGLSSTLKDRINTVLVLAQSIPTLDAAAPDLQPLLERLENSVDGLIALTKQHLFVREDIRQALYRLDSVIEVVDYHPLSQAHSPLASQASHLVDVLRLASLSESVTDIHKLRYRFDLGVQKLNAWNQQNTSDSHDEVGQWAVLLNELAHGNKGIFEQRIHQLEIQERSAFLLATTRAISEQLSGEVKRFVDQIENRMSSQSHQVTAAVKSGKTGIFIISLLCLSAALAGIWVVRELVLSLGQITQVMTRLADGDTHQDTPAIERRDEIGALARAFQVFRENAVEIERISISFREQSRLLETIFKNMNDGLSVFDEQGRMVAWNPQYLAILELPESQLKPGLTLDQVHAMLPKEAQEAWALDGMALDKDTINAARKTQSQRFERHFANGRVVEFRSNPMPGGGFVTLYSDLTERKAIEAQLRQSQKMEVLGQLTGGVAHDFNNLLAAVYGNLQMLEDRLPSDSKEHKYARRALAAAERGAGLTKRLLAFSRKQLLEPQLTEVDSLIEEMADLLEYSVEAQIDIRFDLKAADQWVNVDVGQLENALLNLAINSSAAMAHGGVLTLATQVLANARYEGGSGEVLQITVSDTGQGISEQDLARVFEPFFTTKEIGEGSGLGLSMVYGFVKQSQGDIRITSEPGKGTQVEILLPLATPVAAAQIGPMSSPSDIPRGQGQQILLVEDDVQVRQMAIALIIDLGYRVHWVTSAQDALHYLAHQQSGDDPVNLVFSDINLGAGMNGLQLKAEVALHWPELTTILTSGLSPDQLAHDYDVSGQTLVLAKPFRKESLARALYNGLKSAH
ncbi:MAG: PAS-domain containing protein [Pontibacterium sp.]